MNLNCKLIRFKFQKLTLFVKEKIVWKTSHSKIALSFANIVISSQSILCHLESQNVPSMKNGRKFNEKLPIDEKSILMLLPRILHKGHPDFAIESTNLCNSHFAI